MRNEVRPATELHARRAQRESSRRRRHTSAAAALVVVRQELGLVSRHVDVHRAIAFAAFAGEAEIERFLHRLDRASRPSGRRRQHFEQQTGAAARRVHLLARHLIAGTHRAAVVPAGIRLRPRSARWRARSCRDRSGKWKCVSRLVRIEVGAKRRFSIDPVWSTTLPGFIFHAGSQIVLNSRNASISSGPNIFGSNSARDWPSPCSPESEPP